MDHVDALEAEIAEVYRQWAGDVLASARRLASDGEEARDAVQESFLRYFVERRYGRSIENPRAWLREVARNYLLTRRQSAAARREFLVGVDWAPAASNDAESLASRQERAMRIRGMLTGRELECLRLRAEGHSYTEIATTMGIRSGTVAALLARVQGKLRWPPGRNGKIGLWTAEAIHTLLLGEPSCATPMSPR